MRRLKAMINQAVRVEVYKIKYICDQCSVGEVIANGRVQLILPENYGHTCNFCGQLYWFKTRYPEIEYREIES